MVIASATRFKTTSSGRQTNINRKYNKVLLRRLSALGYRNYLIMSAPQNLLSVSWHLRFSRVCGDELSGPMPRFVAKAAITAMVMLGVSVASVRASGGEPLPGANPILRDVFTADPAPLVVGDTVYLYVGHDEAKGSELFTMNEWLCYSSKDLKNWTNHGPIMKPTDFKWAVRDAWASQVVEKDGKYYFFVTVQHDKTRGSKAIGVAVSDSPTGPFVDARGSALVTDDMTPSPYYGNDIDPSVFIDDDGTAWLSWGNPIPYLVRLKPSLTELDGPIQKLSLPNYTEGPWISKRNGIYYLTYASMAHQGFGERMCYATASKMTGPWTYRGFLTGPAKKSYTIHPGIIDDFKGRSYLFYHNATLTLPDGQTGATGRRAVCVDYLFYDEDGSMQPVVQTAEGVSVPPKPAPSLPWQPGDHGSSDPSLKIVQFSETYPEAWPGKPVVASVSNPFEQTPVAVGFNRDGGVTSFGQTFVPPVDFKLHRLSLYAGDGFGTDPKSPVILGLYDLGPNDPAADMQSYKAETNLLGSGKGLRIAYEPQAAGLLHFDFGQAEQVDLKAGHRYAIEFQGERDSASIFWRRSRSDVYPNGAAFRDRKLVTEKDGKATDFGFALYGTPER
jgi:hypothetical protein